ncbi:MAG: phosphate transport system [Erysipelotrichaceae bacterium]|nr:MAG: phosphate transport system [Erysipelotrichaceae bacterium]
MVRIDVEIQLFKDDIFLMSQKVRRMFVTAVEILHTGNKEKALSVIELDEYVNNANEEINDKAVEVLSLLAPVATDLRIIIAGIKIATDLERIGDYAKAIARFVIKNDDLDEQLLPYIEVIGVKFIEFYDETIVAYINRDVKLALDLPSRDDDIDAAFQKMINYIEQLYDEKKDISHLVPTIGMLRNIERAGDHTKNICEQVIYEVRGQHYDFG